MGKSLCHIISNNTISLLQAPASASRTLRLRSRMNSSCDCPRTLPGGGGAGAPPRPPPPPPPPRRPPPPRPPARAAARGPRRPREARPRRRRPRRPARTPCACRPRTWSWSPTAGPGRRPARWPTSWRPTRPRSWLWRAPTTCGRPCRRREALRCSRGLRCRYVWTVRTSPARAGCASCRTLTRTACTRCGARAVPAPPPRRPPSS